MADLLQEILIAPASTTEAKEFIKGKYSQADCKSVVVDESNGTTNYGVIQAGTTMGKVTSTGFYRPCNKTLANGAVTADTTIVLDSTENWFVGDAIYDDGADTGETVASITDATDLEASGNVTIADNSVIDSGDGSQTAVGILTEAVNTIIGVDAAGAVIASDRAGNILVRGRVDESALTGDTTQQESDLSGITYD